MAEGNSWNMPSIEPGSGGKPGGPNPNRVPWSKRVGTLNAGISGKAEQTETKDHTDSKVHEFLSSIPLKNAFSGLIEKFSRKKASLDLLGDAYTRTTEHLMDKRVFGQRLGDMLGDAVAGAVVSGAAKTAVRVALSASGVGITQMAIIGAVGGGSSAVIREYLKQRRSYNETNYPVGLRSELKHKFKIQNGKAIAMAGLRGAAMGAAGAVIANTVIGMGAEFVSHNEFLQEHVLSGIKNTGEAVMGRVHETLSSGEATAGGVWQTAKSLPGQTVKGVSDTFEGAKHTVSNLWQEKFDGTVTPAHDGIPLAQTPTPPEISTPNAAPIPSTTHIETPTSHVLSGTPVSTEHAIAPSTQPTPALTHQPVSPGISQPTTPDLKPAAVPDTSHLGTPDTNQAVPNIPHEITPSVQEALGKLPPSVSLEAGSNPWNVTHDELLRVLGREPSPAEIMSVTKELCKSSNIGVPEWGISGEFSHTQLPVGFKLNIDDDVKNAILKIAANK